MGYLLERKIFVWQLFALRLGVYNLRSLAEQDSGKAGGSNHSWFHNAWVYGFQNEIVACGGGGEGRNIVGNNVPFRFKHMGYLLKREIFSWKLRNSQLYITASHTEMQHLKSQNSHSTQHSTPGSNLTRKGSIGVNLTRKGSIGAKLNSEYNKITKTKSGSAWSRKESIRAKVHYGSTMTRKTVNLTRNLTQSWVKLPPLFVKSTESWPMTDQWNPFPGHADPRVLEWLNIFFVFPELCMFTDPSESYPDNSPGGQFPWPPYTFWSWWVVLFRGSGPSGELSWWGIVLGIVVLVGNGWASFRGGGALASQMGRGVPLGVQNLTLSQTARHTKNTPCHNIPY